MQVFPSQQVIQIRHHFHRLRPRCCSCMFVPFIPLSFLHQDFKQFLPCNGKHCPNTQYTLQTYTLGAYSTRDKRKLKADRSVGRLICVLKITTKARGEGMASMNHSGSLSEFRINCAWSLLRLLCCPCIHVLNRVASLRIWVFRLLKSAYTFFQ